MSCATLLAALPANYKKHLDPASPMPVRMMAAKGMAPLPPREMVLVLCGHAVSDDEKTSAAAHATLQGLPNKLLLPAIASSLPGEALGIVVDILHAPCDDTQDREEVYKEIVLHRDTPDDTVASLASWASENVSEIIANNQERCLRSELIVDALRKNSSILKSSLDRLFDFLVRSGVIYDGMYEFNEALGRLTPTEKIEVADKIDLPPEVAALVEDTSESDHRADTAATTLDKHEAESEEAKQHVPMLKLINGLKISQKIALALKGNKEARTILIRATNRLVAVAVINSPRITEPEVIAAAQSRSVSDEVIRTIARSKEMTRSYRVKRALVRNPKTPIAVATRFLALLRNADIKDIAKSKNVSGAVTKQAKRLLLRRK